MPRLLTIALTALLAASPLAAAPTPDGCAAAADYSASLGGRALLVMVDGKTVYERYDHGWTAGRPHPLASGTKSVTGLLAAAAIQDQIIDGWDARISDAIPQWRDDPARRDITLRQLLSLSSGLDATDPALESRGGGRLLGEGAARRNARIERSDVPPADDKHAAALAAKMTGAPGRQFEYGPTHFYAFGAYLEARLKAAGSPHRTVEEYFTARIARPVGLNVAYWNRDKLGHVNLPGGMLLTAREWAKLGQLVLQNGAVRNDDGTLTRVLDPALLAECFKPTPANAHYGLTWWLPGGDADAAVADAGNNPNNPLRRRLQASQMQGFTDPAGKPVRVYMAAGLGKQRLLVLPDHNTVIVRFAEATREGLGYSDATLVNLIMGWTSAQPGDARR